MIGNGVPASRLALAAATALCLSAVAACGSSSSTSATGGTSSAGAVSQGGSTSAAATARTSSAPTTSSGGQGPATLWVRAADAPLDKTLVAAWNTANPSRTITLLAIPDAQYVQKLELASRSGDAPDIAVADIANAKALVDANMLQDITSKVDALPYKDALAPAAVNISSKDGKIYGVPHQLDVAVLYYNKKLFTQAGLDPASPPTTFAQIAADAKKISALGNGDYGFYFGGNCAGCNAYTTLPFIWASGGDILNKDGTAATLDDPAVKSTLDLFRTMWTDNDMPPAAKDETGATWLNSFQSGKIGMLALGSFGIGIFKAQKGLDFGITPIPGATGGHSAFVGGDIVGITTGSKHAGTAWDFIAWSLDKQQQTDVNAKAGGLVVRSDDIDNPNTTADPRLAAANALIADARVPNTSKYNSLFIDSTGPFLQLIRTWVFDGDSAGAIKAAKTGFASRLSS
jgi:multiple sugar transport system substrate-binding protein